MCVAGQPGRADERRDDAWKWVGQRNTLCRRQYHADEDAAASREGAVLGLDRDVGGTRLLALEALHRNCYGRRVADLRLGRRVRRSVPGSAARQESFIL